jgi:hypothetical protein
MLTAVLALTTQNSPLLPMKAQWVKAPMALNAMFD